MGRSKKAPVESCGIVGKDVVQGNRGVNKKRGKKPSTYTSSLAIDPDVFTQLVKEITAEVLETGVAGGGPAWSHEAIYTLQTAAESFVAGEFSLAGDSMKRLMGRETLQPRDFQIVQSLCIAEEGFYVAPGEGSRATMNSYIIETCGGKTDEDEPIVED